MKLPFTQTQFLEVFAAYNEAVWPLQIVLNAVAIAMLIVAIRAPEKAGRLVCIGLPCSGRGSRSAITCPSSGRSIQRLFFAGISLAAAGTFLWLGVFRSSLQFHCPHGRPEDHRPCRNLVRAVGYPIIGKATGHSYPATPTFGLPCPTTIFTFCILLMGARPLPRWVLAAPMAWAAIGVAAAFSLGVSQDFALVVMLMLGSYMLVFNQRPAKRASHPKPLGGPA